MSRIGRWRSAVPIMGFAGLGMFAAHAVDYILVSRDPATREHLLNATGHAYLPRALTGVLIGAIIGVFLTAASGLVRERGGRSALGFRPTFVRLAAIQVSAFVALELIERVHAGLPVHHLIGAVIPLGIALQVALAAAGAFVAVLLDRAGAAFARALARPPKPRDARRVEPTPVFDVPAAGRLTSGPGAPRAPPLFA